MTAWSWLGFGVGVVLGGAAVVAGIIVYIYRNPLWK
jgi:hypothetical protein